MGNHNSISIDIISNCFEYNYKNYYKLSIDSDANPDAPKWPDSVYISNEVTGIFDGLMWLEIKHIAYKNHLHNDEKKALINYLSGLEIEYTAELLQYNSDSAYQVLTSAICKMKRYEHFGLITSTLEVIGWEALRHLKEMN